MEESCVHVGPCASFPELISGTFRIEGARHGLPAVFALAPLPRLYKFSRVLVNIDGVWTGE
jgi:hypothetical protein